MIMEQKLILIGVDHGLLIMKEGAGWTTSDTCRR
jgi:hypothetical protein